MKQPTLTVIYQGLVDNELDNILKEVIPSSCEELEVKANCYFQEYSNFEREIGWELSRELTTEEISDLKDVIESEFTELQVNYLVHEKA